MKSFTSISTAVRYVVLFMSSVLFSKTEIKACGPDFTGWQYSLLLEHYTFNHKFFPYQFDPNSRFYSLSWQDYNEEHVGNDATKYNVASWRQYLKLPASVHDTTIKEFIYSNSSNALKSAFSANNTELVKNIRSRNNGDEVMQYLLFLNEYKQVMAPSKDMWDYASYTSTVPLATMQSFIQQCEELIYKSDDAFLQWRLLYLVMRATHFNKHHAEAVALYEKHEPKLKKDNSLAQYWCEGMYAGALLRNKQHDKAIYHSARAFANCPDQQMQAMNTYLFSNRNWKSALPYCRNANDSVYVAMLEGANHTLPDMEFIQLVYNANPNSEVLKLLWLREAAKIETFLYRGENADGKKVFFPDYDKALDMDSLYSVTKTLLQFLSLSEKIMNAPTDIPAKVTVANTLVFYYYKNNDYRKAAECLDKIAVLPKDEIEKMQYRMLSSLITLKNKKQFDSAHFISLLNEFKKIPSGSTNHHVGYYLLFNEIAPHLLAQRDTSAAFWAYTYANCFESDSFNIYAQDYSPESFNHANFATWLLNQHFTIDQVEELKTNYLRRKGRNEFESYLIKQTKLADGARLFNLVIARKYMLAEQWDRALNIYPELPASYIAQMGPNPANFYINDYIGDDDVQAAKNTYTIKQILELAQKLKSIADGNSAFSAKDKLLYGTLLYNLSFYGKNHYVLDNHWNHSLSETAYFDYDSVDTHIYLNGEDRYTMPLHKSYKNYFHLPVAEKYFSAALPGLSTDEEKAQCTFLLAKCWQKRCPRIMEYNTEFKYLFRIENYEKNSFTNPYFKDLAVLYKNTKTQEQIFNSCSYYRMYLGKK